MASSVVDIGRPIWLLVAAMLTIADVLSNWLVALIWLTSAEWTWSSVAVILLFISSSFNGFFAMNDKHVGTFVQQRHTKFLLGFLNLHIVCITVVALEDCWHRCSGVHLENDCIQISAAEHSEKSAIGARQPHLDKPLDAVREGSSRSASLLAVTAMPRSMSEQMVCSRVATEPLRKWRVFKSFSRSVGLVNRTIFGPRAGSLQARLSAGAGKGPEAEEQAVGAAVVGGGGGAEQRMQRIRKLQEEYRFQASSTEIQRAADWTRMVTSLFLDMPTLALHIYTLLLTREFPVLTVLSVGIGFLALSCNMVAVYVGDQPAMRRVVTFTHTLGQLAFRSFTVAFLVVRQSQNSVPFIMLSMCVSLMFSAHIYRLESLLVSNIFALPLWFICWDTMRIKKADIFGWQADSDQDHNTLFLRLFIFLRLVEGLLLLFLAKFMEPVMPCDPRSLLRYHSSGCEGSPCCRGPVRDLEMLGLCGVSVLLYIGSWVFGYYLDNW